MIFLTASKIGWREFVYFEKERSIYINELFNVDYRAFHTAFCYFI